MPPPPRDTIGESLDLSRAENALYMNRIRFALATAFLLLFHSGTAVVGNIGAANRREFTAIGDTVNVASRLQSLTRDRNTTILASEAVVAALADGHPPGVILTPAGTAEVRGRTQGVALFIPERNPPTPQVHG